MTTESSSDQAIAQTGMDQELVESHIREAYWLADTGDIAALEAHLAEMNNEEIVELLTVVFEDRLTSIWKAIPAERQAELSGQLEPAAMEVISSGTENPPEATLLKTLLELSALNASEEIQQTVADRDINDLADVLEAMPAPARSKIWNSIQEERRAEVLTLLDEGVRNSLLSKLDEGEVLPLVAELTTSELADVMDAVHEDVADAILRSLPEAEREDMEKVLAYEDDSAGRWMESEWIAIRADVALDVVARYLKRLGRMPPHTDGLMVIDREGHYLGKLPVSALLTQDEALDVEEVMEKDVDWVTTETDQAAIVGLFERREVSSIAVVDGEHKLIGRITVDDILNVVREEAEAPLLHMAGLEEGEDLFAPILSSSRRRMFWLGINLATAFLASYVIGLFESTLERVVALAVLMPIVASMGGIAGSQTLTLAIRGLALGQISDANTRWLAIKEITIAGINGLVWATVVGSLAFIWFGDIRISVIIAVAMIINQFAAAMAGLAVPLILDRINIDPALSGSVILTTVTDVVGFMSFLGLATLVL